MYKLLILTSLLLLTTVQGFSQSLNGGEVVGRHIYGLATDYQGDPVLIEDRPLIYKTSDFEETLTIEKSKFLVSGFSSQIGGIYITQLDPKSNNPLDTIALDLAKVDGFSSPVDGKKTNWNSVLMAESNIVNAAKPSEFIKTFKSYYKGKSNLVKPYKYGWVSEVIVFDSQGQAKAIKNYALGRVFANQVISMPDNKTLYMLDKLGNLYLFVANQAKSLAKGDLYAISRQQDQISYHLLGKSAALKVKFKLKKVKFESIFKSKTPKKQSCGKSYQYIKTLYGEECLKVQRKYKKYAAFFEPIRIMTMKGISPFTTEGSRMSFDMSKKELSFKQAEQGEIKLALGNNPEIKSQFVIKEP